MEKVSVTIITLNEEANIKDCLRSVSWADEVIVSDSGSTDGTVEACKAFGATVYVDPWLGFGRQKNLCQDRARNGWVLNIDADERVTPELRDEILACLDGTDMDGYFVARKNFFGPLWIKHCGWYPDYNLRLYRKDLGRFSEKNVHESVLLQGRKGYLENPLIHLTYRDVSDYMKRMERYSALAAKDMFEGGRRGNLLDLFIRPHLTFLKMFFLKRGFLDGKTGLLLSYLYALYTFEKYSKLRELNKNRGLS